jgi:hypothetical protein
MRRRLVTNFRIEDGATDKALTACGRRRFVGGRDAVKTVVGEENSRSAAIATVELRWCDDPSGARMSKIILRGGVELENPLELVLEFLEAYSSNEAYDSSGPASFDEGGPQELCEHTRLRSGIALPCGRQSPKGVAPCVSRTTA